MDSPIEIPILQSLADLRELVFECLEISGARTVVEIGAETGALTAFLAEWAEARSAHVYSIEPEPAQSLREIVEQSPAVDLVADRSPGCLADIEAADAYVIDGDHNYYTVSAELSAIVSMVKPPRGLPLVLLHDVEWPWGRRDLYYSPDLLPEAALLPYTLTGGILPSTVEVVEAGILNAGNWAMAKMEGGDRNGVQTAVDDFLAKDPRYGYFVVPVIFGLGILYPTNARYAGRLKSFVGPLHDNPILRRIESNRLELVTAAQTSGRTVEGLQRMAEDHQRLVAERETLLAVKNKPGEETGELGVQIGRLEMEKAQLAHALNEAKSTVARTHEQLARSQVEIGRLKTEGGQFAGALTEAGSTLNRAHERLSRAEAEVDRVRAERDRVELRLLSDERTSLGLDQAAARLKPAVAKREPTVATMLALRSRRAKTLLRALKRRL